MTAEVIGIIITVVLAIIGAAVKFGELTARLDQKDKEQTHNDERFKELYDSRNALHDEIIRTEAKQGS